MNCVKYVCFVCTLSLVKVLILLTCDSQTNNLFASRRNCLTANVICGRSGRFKWIWWTNNGMGDCHCPPPCEKWPPLWQVESPTHWEWKMAGRTGKKKTLISVKSRISSKQNGERLGREKEGTERDSMGRGISSRGTSWQIPNRSELKRSKKKQSTASRTVETQNAKVKEN